MSISVYPRATEKAFGLSAQNVYVFDAPLSANRQEIAAAVSEQFGVRVVSIKTLVQNGKAVRFSQGRRRNPGSTVRSDRKKAYVTLAEGDKIALFDEQAAPAAEPAKKSAKKEAK